MRVSVAIGSSSRCSRFETAHSSSRTGPIGGIGRENYSSEPKVAILVATLVEGNSRLTVLVHLPATDSVTVAGAICTALSGLPTSLVASLTWDQGTEMTRHLSVTAALAIPVYFCVPHAPWQRGSVAAWIEREHQWAAPPALPKGQRSGRALC